MSQEDVEMQDESDEEEEQEAFAETANPSDSLATSLEVEIEDDTDFSAEHDSRLIAEVSTLTPSERRQLLSSETDNILRQLYESYQKRSQDGRTESEEGEEEPQEGKDESAEERSEEEDKQRLTRSGSEESVGSFADDVKDVDYVQEETESSESKDFVDDDEDDTDYIPRSQKTPKTKKTPKKTLKRVARRKEPLRKAPASSLTTDDFATFIDSRIKEYMGELEEPIPVKPRFDRRLPEELMSLIGQANMSYMKGRVDEAILMCEEVIRKQPNHFAGYEAMACFWEEKGDRQKCFQYSLLAAMLDPRCCAERWETLGDNAVELGQEEQAACCYHKALRAAPAEWRYYEKKIVVLERMGQSKKVLSTLQLAVKSLVDGTTWPVNRYLKFTADVAEKSLRAEDRRGAAMCIKYHVVRCFTEKLPTNEMVLKYLDLMVPEQEYTKCLTVVLSYTKIKACSGKTVLTNFENPATLAITRYLLPVDFPPKITFFTILCWLHLKQIDNAKYLLDYLFHCLDLSRNVGLYMKIARVLADNHYLVEAEQLLAKLVRQQTVDSSVWLRFGEVLKARGRMDTAVDAFKKALELAPHSANAILNLAALQQQLGRTEAAMRTLDMVDDESPDSLRYLDERLLYQRCLMFEKKGNWTRFTSCAEKLLAMFFKAVHNILDSKSRIQRNKCAFFRMAFLDQVRGSAFTHLITKVSSPTGKMTITADELWAVYQKMISLCFDKRDFASMLCLSGYATLCPLFVEAGYSDDAGRMAMLACIRGRYPKVLWGYIRDYCDIEDNNRIWNMLGLMFVMHHEMRDHRYVLRQMLRFPNSRALPWMSGNNSLYAGTYSHALVEYLSIMPHFPANALLNFLIGLTFIHLASKKDIARRYDTCLQGLAFLSKYEELRGECQEVYYNWGRAMHQLGILYAAVHNYKKVLELPPSVVLETKDDRDTDSSSNLYLSNPFDLRIYAAHNLALIYYKSGNVLKAQELLNKYCRV